MLKSDVLRYFDHNMAKVGRALGVGRATVHKWGDLVPPLAAARLHKITRGALHFNPDEYPPRRKPNKSLDVRC